MGMRAGGAAAMAVVLWFGSVGMAEPGPVSREARASAQCALALSADDRTILQTFAPPPGQFIERPGVMEFSGQLVVKVKPPQAFIPARPGAEPTRAETDAALARVEHARARLAPSLVEAYHDVDEHSILIPDGWDEDTLAALLMATGDYEWAEPNWRVYPALEPNDPQLGNQIHHNVMSTRDAWDHTTGDPSVIVGICDTGIDQDHPDLAAAILPGFNAVTDLEEISGGDVTDFNGHGTGVAGCAAAIGNNAVGVVGMGWNFQILPVKVSENPDGTALISDLTQGARWASDNGARVVSVSYGGVQTSQVNSAGTHIKNENHLLCWAAGNEGSFLGSFDWEDVIVVGASSNVDSLAAFSNFGPGIDVVAPGVNVRTTQNGGGYGGSSGTSFSTPIVNGLLALIWSVDLSMTADEVEQLLYDQAIDLGTPGEDDDWGNGRADAGASVTYAATGAGPRPLPFADDFESGLDPNDWTTTVNAAASSDADNPPSGSMAARLTGAAELTSEIIKARSALNGGLVVSFSVQRRGVEAGESLIVEMSDILNGWQNVATIVSDGADPGVFGRYVVAYPILSGMDTARLRFRTTGNEANDEWFVDDVHVGLPVPASIPLADNFEGNLDLFGAYASNSGAVITTAADAEPSGTNALALGGSDSIETLDLPAQSLFGTTLYARMFAQPAADVPSGGSVALEYLSPLSTWQPLAEAVSDSSAGAFELLQVELPALAFWDGLRLRVRASTAAGEWYVDDLYLGEDELVLNPGCNDADLAEPFGTLDFSDVIAFLSAFGSSDPAADLAAPFGVFDFSDVIAFLSAFGAGCP